jgi:hypothetical protein
MPPPEEVLLDDVLLDEDELLELEELDELLLDEEEELLELEELEELELEELEDDEELLPEPVPSPTQLGVVKVPL